MSVSKKKLFVVLAVALMLCASGIVCTGFFSERSANASTVSAQPVTLDELIERHGIVATIGPGGKANGYDYNADELLKIDANGVLKGWKSNWTNTTIKSVLIVPNSVKKVEAKSAEESGIAFSSNGAIVETLVGVWFQDESALTSIDVGFKDCNNMRFCRLPKKNFTIGASAFEGCSQLRDIIVPEGVVSLGARAFASCSNLCHISVPTSVTSIASDAFEETHSLCDVEFNANVALITDTTSVSSYFPYAMNIYYDVAKFNAEFPDVTPNIDAVKTRSYLYLTNDGDNSLAFSLNNLCEQRLATISGANKNYEINKWYFVGLAGLEDKNCVTRYVFPNEIDLSAARETVAWDYLNDEGKKVKNNLTGKVTSYDIGVYACRDAFMARQVFIPEAVKVIGDRAFYNSHVRNADIAETVTHIGELAFKGSNHGVTQHYYLRKTDPNAALHIGDYAFDACSSWGAPQANFSRRVIFENKAVYDKEIERKNVYLSTDRNVDLSTSISFTYRVPIETVVQDGDNTVTEIFGYRLFGNYGYNCTENHDGTWSDTVQNSDGTFLDVYKSVAFPNITGNESTVWYTQNDYASVADVKYVGEALNVNGVEKVRLYSRKLGAPNIAPREYEYSPSLDVSFTDAADFGEDYTGELTGYADPSNSTPPQSEWPVSVSVAGKYTVRAQLAEKWGVWTAENAKKYETTVTVRQAEINLNETGILVWTVKGAAAQLEGDNTPLYKYSDGWYLSSKDTEPLESKNVTNSYVRVDGGRVFNIDIPTTSRHFTVREFGNHVDKSESGQYYTSFTLVTENLNYRFVLNSTTTEDFVLRGISGISLSDNNTVVTLSKCWYIVNQSNWLTNNDKEGEEYGAPSFSIAEKDGKTVSGWTYGDTTVTVHSPALAFTVEGAGNGNITFTLAYGDTPIVTDAPASDFKEYINPSMPAGTYSVSIHADAVGAYSEINQRFTLSVSPKQMEEALYAPLNEALKGKLFEQAYNGELFLHDSFDSINSLLQTDMHPLRKGENTVWGAQKYDGYYSSLSLAYNLDRMQSSRYYTASEMAAGGVFAPREVNEYTVYYSLSAANYRSLGGADDVSRRDYRFATVIYREISVPVLSSVTYNGGRISPDVPYNQYYVYSLNESENYTDAGDYTVTVTLTDGVLSRWSEVPQGVTLSGEKNEIATLPFKIGQAENRWLASPQISDWTYNGFNRGVNTVSALLQYSAETQFGIGSKNSDGGFNWLDFDGHGNRFMLEADGRVPEWVAEKLNSLTPGEYYLGSWVSADEKGNVKSFSTDSNLYNRIRVGKAANRWTSSPNVIRWAWRSYDENSNLLTATPLYPVLGAGETLDGKVLFTVLNSDKVLAGQNLAGFALAGGKVNGAVKQALNGLSAGRYYLLASVADTDCYYGLNYVEDLLNHDFAADLSLDLIPFEITVAANSWTQTPIVISWTYNGFGSEANFVAGQAAHGNSVKYGVYKSYQDGVLSGAEFENITDVDTVTDKMKVLGAGSYYLHVLTEGVENNYSKVESVVQFEVKTASNSWIAAPLLEDWTFGDSVSVTAPQSAYGTPNFELDGKPLAATELNAELAKLNAGEHTLSVKVNEDKNGDEVNYTGLSETIKFNVRKANNAWLDSALPSVEDLTYNGTATPSPSDGSPLYTWTGQNVSRQYYKSVWSVAQNAYVTEGDPLSAAPIDAGRYAYVTAVDGNANYNELRYVAFFEIAKASNSWTSGSLQNIGWEWTEDGSNASWIPLGSEFGSPEFSVSGVAGASGLTADKINEALKSLDAGTYTLIATVPESGNYAGLNDTLTVTVRRAPNALQNMTIASSWFWNPSLSDSDLGWNAPMPQHGNVVALTVTDKSGTSDSIYIELHYDASGNLTQAEASAVKAVFKSLGAGEYTVRASVAQQNNYAGHEQILSFSVKQAVNKWINGGSPSMSKTSWNYGSESGSPSAQSAYGNVLVRYYTVSNSGGTETMQLFGDGTVMPVNAGNYAVGFSVAADSAGNYSGITEQFVKFAVLKADNRTFSVNPHAVGWTWREYDKSVNLFAAVPATGGKVTFTVLSGTSAVMGLENIELNKDGIIADADGTLTKKLSELNAATYVLRVNVGAMPNYNAFTSDVEFRVTKATNGWLSTPSVATWSEYEWKAANNTPVAASKYGDVRITVKSKADSKVYYDALHKSDGTVSENENKLIEALGGWYVLAAEVADGDNYTGLKNGFEFQVFLSSVDMPANYWVTIPSIESWIAGSSASVPQGAALRGIEEFTYRRVELKDGKYVTVEELGEVVPSAPGKYIMRAHVSNPARPQDELNQEVMFEIFYRVNEWKDAPGIQSWYLGDAPSKPVASALYSSADELTILYKKKGYDDSLAVKELPDEPGEYVMIVTATAKYCEPIKAYIDFSVWLSKNGWLTAPVIKDWSAEVGPNLPTGEAIYGEIQYIYKKLDGTVLSGAPTEEGEYILVARVEVDGYETLEAEYKFTVTPAFDITLVMLNILLGVIACAFAVVVIIFAVRRYKQC